MYVTADHGTVYENTQICTEAYTGKGCAQCAEGYYQQNSRCGGSDQTAQMVAIAFAAAIVTDCLSLGVALQQVSAAGSQGALSIPGESGAHLSIFFT